jgi:squalene synthase HpnC
MSVDHYENFPVASLLLPARLRRPVAAIYAFARSADDIADEGQMSDSARLAGLAAYAEGLDRIAAGLPATTPMFARLSETVCEHQLPLAPLRDLLSAFRQDVTTQRYADYPTLLDYCSRSANPVGRLMLALYKVPFGAMESQRLIESDRICTALQLINFWQDVAIDLQKDRIYLPQDQMTRFGVSLETLRAQPDSAAWRALLAGQIESTRAMMLAGAPLALALPGRIGLELRLVVQGGLRILEKIEANDYDVFRRRPVLRAPDWLLLSTRLGARRFAAPLTIPT